MTRSAWLDSPLKRGTDVLIAVAVVIVASPILVITAIAVRLRLGPPVLFRQQRAGRAGRPIDVVKFRSMTDEHGPDGRLLDDEERLPAFGRRLRSSSLDELPQLFSVLRGDMSLIGPRPLPLAYVERYDDGQRRRLDATPGITGWAQVNGRNSLDWPTKLALDVWYVDHASPRVDATILARTARAVFSRSGVAATDHATMPEFLGTDARFTATGTPTAVDGVEIAVFEGEAVLFDEATSMLHRLGAIAGGVWLYCDGETDVTTMIAELAGTFDLDADEVTPIVYETIERFADEGLLVGHDSMARLAPPEPTLAADGTEILTGPPDP